MLCKYQYMSLKNYLKFELEQINKKYNRIEISLLLNIKDVTK